MLTPDRIRGSGEVVEDGILDFRSSPDRRRAMGVGVHGCSGQAAHFALVLCMYCIIIVQYNTARDFSAEHGQSTTFRLNKPLRVGG